jgi:hypothetical protein
MHIDSVAGIAPLIVIALTIWLMRARFSIPLDNSWPLVYYTFLAIFVRANEGEFNNYWIFSGILCALFMRYEFMTGSILKAFRTGEFVVHVYVIGGCFLIMTRI